MKKAFRISLSVLLLALAFAVVQIPSESVSADTVSVSNDADFQMNGTTLMKYTGTAQTVSVPASVEKIGEEAFANHPEMETLQFKGNKVEDIAYRAFAGCNGLKEVKLPDYVVSIGNGAFSDCCSLKKVILGDAVHDIGIGVFAGCKELSTLDIAKNNPNFIVDDDCLYNKDKTKLYMILPKRLKETYSMPNTVTDIAEYAFWNCDKLTGVSLSSNLNKIPDYAFSNCKALAGITIPYSVKSIGIKAFSDCVNLNTVTMSASVSSIHDTAFDGCLKLNIVADIGTTGYEFYQKFKKRNQAEYEDAGSLYPSIDDLLNTDISKDDQDKVADDSALLASTVVVANQAVFFIDNSKANVYGNDTFYDTVSGGSVSVLENELLQKETDIPKYTIANEKCISDLAFYKKKDINNYEIDDNITEVGEFSFARSSLNKIVLPNGLEKIDYGAFYHCDYLREVTIPNSVTYIAPEAFQKTLWLTTWLNSAGENDYLIVGNGILLAYRGNGGHIEIPDTVKRIGSQAFKDNNTILSVYIPDSVIEIGEEAFYNCKNLTEVTGCKNVNKISDRAFSGCLINTAHITEKVKQIGLNAFDFSKTGAGDSSKVIVFDGTEELPIISYEETACRLSNDNARGAALGDTVFAIVDQHIKADELMGTVLDPNGYGFYGITGYISSRDKAQITCIASSLTEEQLKSIYIPEYITIDKKTYQVLGINEISVYRQNTILDENNIQIKNQSNYINQVHDVYMEGIVHPYILSFNDNDEAYQRINQAYEAVYRQSLPGNTVCTDITLLDSISNVPILKTGNQKVSISLSLSDSIMKGSIRILTVDRNGQLENISYQRNDNEITFSVNHFSPFAFVNVSNTSNLYAQEKISNEEAIITGYRTLDQSPDTGDYIHPKWFIAMILVSLSIIVLVFKRQPKFNKNVDK